MHIIIVSSAYQNVVTKLIKIIEHAWMLFLEKVYDLSSSVQLMQNTDYNDISLLGKMF